MKIKVNQFIRFAASVADQPILTIGRNKTFTVKPSGSGVVFLPEGNVPRPLSANDIRRYLEIYNAAQNFNTAPYSGFFHASYVLGLIREITGSNSVDDTPPALSLNGQRLLTAIVNRIRAGRIQPGRPDTFPSYSDLLRSLGLPTRPRPGVLLRGRGMDELDFWSIELELPAITGLIVEELTTRPGRGFWRSHPAPADANRDAWWLAQMARVIAYDWSPYLVSMDEVSPDAPEPSTRIIPGRETVIVTRVIRDSQIISELKAVYRGRCQLCDTTIKLPSGDYVEAHHLWPLGEGGSDTKDNLICVCPNCHTRLDFAAIPFDRKDLVTDLHPLNQGNIDHHNDRYRKRAPELAVGSTTVQPAQ